MAEPVEDSLKRRTWRLLQPGEVALNGAIVQTALGSEDDIGMQQATIEIGDLIASHAGFDPDETYVYSGTDDPEFGTNQHQGLTLDDDEFVWECQQLLREGTFDLVFYYRATVDHQGLLEAIRDAEYSVTGVRGEADPDEL